MYLTSQDLNKGQIELALAACSGRVEVTRKTFQKVQSGGEGLSGALTGIIAFIEQIFQDVYACTLGRLALAIERCAQSII